MRDEYDRTTETVHRSTHRLCVCVHVTEPVDLRTHARQRDSVHVEPLFGQLGLDSRPGPGPVPGTVHQDDLG
jgi:hypothetical protein